jgi:predicted transcriptional regulator
MDPQVSRVSGDTEDKLRFTRETLTHLNTLEDVATLATTTLFSVIPTHKIAVAVIEGKNLRSVSTLGKRVFLDLDLAQHSINARTIRTERTQLVNDTSKDPDYFPGDPNEAMSSELCVPLIHDGSVLGTINFEHQSPGRYTEEDTRAAEELAAEVARAIHRVQQDKPPATAQVRARSPIEINRDLLRTVYEGETVLNRILNNTAIQWKHGKELVDNLVTKGHLAIEKTSARRYNIRITDEGVQALKIYEDVLERLARKAGPL